MTTTAQVLRREGVETPTLRDHLEAAEIAHGREGGSMANRKIGKKRKAARRSPERRRLRNARKRRPDATRNETRSEQTPLESMPQIGSQAPETAH